MDSNDLEREKGITILAKNTSIDYNGFRINIVDTPGHADFGGEVERIMRMVDGVLLVVDAYEGCMPQTRFVLLYASGVKGLASDSPDELGNDIMPLLESIVRYIPAPDGDLNGALQAQITLMDYNEFIGKIAVSTINRGTVHTGQTVSIMSNDGKVRNVRVTKLYGFKGLKHVDIDEAGVGEIVAIAGLGEINVGETVCQQGQMDPLPFIHIEDPTIEMMFLINNSPFAGKDGDPVTSRKLWARLEKETESDIALHVSETDSADMFRVAGRGELHLSILIEKMRREGLEFQVSMPQVIVREVDGIKMEPFEYVSLDVPEDYMGVVMEKMSQRKGEMRNMINRDGQVRLEYIIPSRGLVGFRTQFLTDTHGYGIMNATFEDYRPWTGNIEGRRTGALIVHETGVSTAYGLNIAEERGVLFIGPGEEVYEGMIIGESSRDQDITVNVCKGKKLTNTRAAGKDDAVQLKGARDMSMEQCIAFLNEDEYLEVTPEHLRMRKRFLKADDRAKYNKNRKLGQG